MHDKELYQHVNHMAKNLDELSRDLKPIVNNVAIFTDKLARHPSVVGLGGALKKDTGLKDNPLDDGPDGEIPQTSRFPLGGSGQFGFGQ